MNPDRVICLYQNVITIGFYFMHDFPCTYHLYDTLAINYICFIICLFSAGLLCYFCHDTSNEEGKNKCQTYYRTMRYYGKKANETGSFKTDKYVKNCSDYGAPDKPKYCMIASVEERSNTNNVLCLISYHLYERSAPLVSLLFLFKPGTEDIVPSVPVKTKFHLQ
jgi:hypothetical protein